VTEHHDPAELVTANRYPVPVYLRVEDFLMCSWCGPFGDIEIETPTFLANVDQR
jgi:hypothetical protein